jgi:glycosyltransferase involved in cell wall biosynthesis
MLFMSQEASDESNRSDLTITERTAEQYREHVISELETENARLREWTDTLQRSLDERTSELRAFGIAAQAVKGARRLVHQPTLLARVPRAALRALRGDGRGQGVGRRQVPVPPAARRLAGAALSARIHSPRDLSALTVALVVDEPLALALGPECRTIRLTPGTWQPALEADLPDFLLVESAWRGTAGAWQYRIAWYGHASSIGLVDLRALTEWCASKGVPSVFWDTSGPVGLGRFDEAASLFDVILTADAAALAHYDCLATRQATIVDVLEPGIQFRDHHPGAVGEDRPEGGSRALAGGPIFVGSYDRERPLADREALDRLLDAGLQRGLRIHDVGGVAGPDAPGFPERFRAAIQPFVGTAALPDLLRAASVVLVDAPGGEAELLPLGLLEALACGTPAVSTPSLSVRARFGDDVPGAAPADDPNEALDLVLADPAAARRRIRGNVLPALARDFLIRERLGRLATAVGIATLPPPRAIAVALLHDEASGTASLVQALAEVGHASEFLVGTTDWEGAGKPLAEALRAARPLVPVRLVEQVSGSTTAHRLERLAGATEADWIAAWSGRASADSGSVDPDRGQDPLEPLLLAIAFADGDRAFGEDARMPMAIRRQAVGVQGWPEEREVGRVSVGGPAR